VIHRHRNLASFVYSNATHQGYRVAQNSRREQLLSARVRGASPRLPADENGEDDEIGYDGEASVAGTETSRSSLTSVD
jgi:hypothetical protein